MLAFVCLFVLFTRWLLIGAYLLGGFGFPEYCLKICLLLRDLGGSMGNGFLGILEGQQANPIFFIVIHAAPPDILVS